MQNFTVQTTSLCEAKLHNISLAARRTQQKARFKEARLLLLFPRKIFPSCHCEVDAVDRGNLCLAMRDTFASYGAYSYCLRATNGRPYKKNNSRFVGAAIGRPRFTMQVPGLPRTDFRGRCRTLAMTHLFDFYVPFPILRIGKYLNSSFFIIL